MTCPHEAMPLPCPQSDEIGQKGMDMTIARAPGRPKDMEKLCAILDASLKLFSARGIDGVAVEAIAAEAGVSKVTIYANFKDKNAIMVALVQRAALGLERLILDASQTDGDLKTKLTQIGMALVEFMVDPARAKMERCLSMEKERNPDLARQFFDAGPGRLRDLLANLLTEACNCGEMNLACSRMAAEDLLGLWLGFSAIERRYFACPPDAAVLRQRVKHGVDFFVRSHRP